MVFQIGLLSLDARTAPERCWIDIELEGQLLPVAISLCNVDAYVLELLLGRSDCSALRGLALAGHLDVLVVHGDVRLDQS